MATYQVEITLNEGQDKVLKKAAKDQERPIQEVLNDLGASVVGQIDQWIRDRVRTKMDKLSPADQLARLSYFDGE